MRVRTAILLFVCASCRRAPPPIDADPADATRRDAIEQAQGIPEPQWSYDDVNDFVSFPPLDVDAEAIATSLTFPATCDRFHEQDPPAMRVYRLDDDALLVGVLCDSAAYNASVAWFVSRRTTGASIPLRFEAWDADAHMLATKDVVVGHVHFDPATRQIRAFTKFLGSGDCGRWSRYRVERDRTTLLEIREKSDCTTPAGDVRGWWLVAP